MACGSGRPAITSSSSTLSKIALSLPPSRMIGTIFFRSSPSRSDCEQRLARLHPVDVAAQRVDLAVVRDVAVGVRQRPRRERVGAEALVHQRQRRLERRIGEIGEHPVDLVGGQHALVDQRPRRQADDVEELRGPAIVERVDGVLDRACGSRTACARTPRPARAGRAGAASPGRGRSRSAGTPAATATALGPSGAVVGRHVAPADQPLPFLGDDPLEQALDAPRGSPASCGRKTSPAP